MKPSSLLSRPIAFHRVFVTILGDVDSALFLSQALYWSRRSEGGWFYKSREEWADETSLGRSAQESSRKKLKAISLLEEREDRINHRLWFRVDMDKLDEILLTIPDEIEPPARQRYRLPGGCLTATPKAVLPPSSNGAETTAETTAETSAVTADGTAVDNKALVTGEHAQFIADWTLYYERRTKQKYPFNGRDGKAVKTLLKHFGGIDPAKTFIKACHARSKEGFPFGATETLPDLANGIARLQAALATPPKQNGRPQTPRGVPVAAQDMPRIV